MATAIKPIEDFGEKIGGARKDLRGNFTLNDLGTLTPVERVKLVRKDMVWPTPDYVKMVKEDGYSVEAAAMVKMLRDSFPSAPIVHEGSSEESFTKACILFVQTLNVAKQISQNGKTPAELSQAMINHPETPVYLARIEKTNTGISIRSGDQLPQWRAGPLSTMALSWRQFNDLHDAFASFAVASLDRTMRRTLRRNPQWPEGTSLAEAWIKRVGLSIAPQGNGYCVAVSRRPLDESEWRYIGRPAGFTELIGKTFETAEQAQVALNKSAEERFAAKRAEAKRKHQEVMDRAKGTSEKRDIDGYRQGPEWRAAPAVTDDYLQKFRLRGGEFGLWVNQSERQQVLDRGYDALRDLADMFNWPSEAISLGGTLAIAFGARGRGGKTPAAAHYEPGRKVINLTKPHGEGCLAHEWAHALDHYLGERARRLGILRVSVAAPFLSGGVLDRKAVAELGHSEEVKFLVRIREFTDLLQRQTISQPEEPGRYQSIYNAPPRPPITVDSNYLKSCRELDKMAGKTYFSLPHEMFARGFEACVADQLTANKRDNPYLVSGARGLAYPAAEERQLFAHSITETLKNFPEYVPSIGLPEMVDRRRALTEKVDQAETVQIGNASAMRHSL